MKKRGRPPRHEQSATAASAAAGDKHAPPPSLASSSSSTAASPSPAVLAHRQWLSRVPLLYDVCSSFGLTWASLSATFVDLGPEAEAAQESGDSVHAAMLVATHTSGNCPCTQQAKVRAMPASAMSAVSSCTRSLSACPLAAVPNSLQQLHASLPNPQRRDPMQGQRRGSERKMRMTGSSARNGLLMLLSLSVICLSLSTASACRPNRRREHGRKCRFSFRRRRR